MQMVPLIFSPCFSDIFRIFRFSSMLMKSEFSDFPHAFVLLFRLNPNFDGEVSKHDEIKT